MGDNELKDSAEEVKMTPAEIAAEWENYVRNEVNALLDIFLPEAITGNVGVMYKRPVKSVDVKTGKQIIDEDKAIGVDIHIVFDFPEPVQFFDSKPSE
jgi:hypothetical protein